VVIPTFLRIAIEVIMISRMVRKRNFQCKINRSKARDTITLFAPLPIRYGLVCFILRPCQHDDGYMTVGQILRSTLTNGHRFTELGLP